jgi:two-component system phosphate regulon response regulator OmpR
MNDAPPSPHPSLLVVEDDLPVREMACHILEGAGYRVTPAGSAEEATALAGDHRFDALFCDVMLPGASGIDLAGWLRTTHPEVAILLTSGQRTPDVRASVEAVGLPFLPKPYTAEQLAASLAAVLARANGATG